MKQDAEGEAARMRSLEDEFDDPDKPQRKYMIKNPERVLVRLKVEHTGFTTLNNQRFGSQFVGQVVSSSLMMFPALLFTQLYNIRYRKCNVSPILHEGQPLRHSTLPQAPSGRKR